MGAKYAYALDYTAVLLYADAIGADTLLLVQVLPYIEQIVLEGWRLAVDAASPE